MTRPKVPPGKFATHPPRPTSDLARLDQRQRTAQACESCKRRKQKVRLSRKSHIAPRKRAIPILSAYAGTPACCRMANLLYPPRTSYRVPLLLCCLLGRHYHAQLLTHPMPRAPLSTYPLPPFSTPVSVRPVAAPRHASDPASSYKRPEAFSLNTATSFQPSYRLRPSVPCPPWIRRPCR